MKKSFWSIFLNLLLSVVMFISFSACGSQRYAQRSSQLPIKPKAMVTPWNYYKSARSAELRKEDPVEVEQVEMQTMGEDTKKDKTGVILIGTLVGVLVVGGAVTAVLLTR